VNARRLSLLLLAPWLAGGCFLFRSPAPVITPIPPPAFSFDPNLLGKDAGGLAAAAERLCSPLTTRQQKALGFALAQKGHEASPHHVGAALALARCAALRAEWESEPNLLEQIAEVGIEAAKSAGAPDHDPRAAYWMSVSLGLSIRLRGYAALPLLPTEMAALKTAQKAPELEMGGPLRALGMLYLKAPGWPAGPGDLDEAVELLKTAAEAYPSHPLNHLYYADALREKGDGATATVELQRAADLARPELWGEYAAKWQADIQALAK
jgi:hypothetical protein